MATEEIKLGDVDAIDELCVISIFDEAAAYLSGNSRIKLNSEQKLAFYGLFKQATVGPCDRPKPGLLEMVERAKWAAWKQLGKMSKEEAVAQYVRLLDRVAPQWKQETGEMAEDDGDEAERQRERQQGGGGGGLSTSPNVSRPLQSDSGAPSGPSDLCSLAADGDTAAVLALLQSGVPLSYSNADGQTALMLAVDRGQEGMVELLLRKAREQGGAAAALINAKDADGMTALHYACVCERDGCLQKLVAAGADPDITSNEGETCWDCASDAGKQTLTSAMQQRKGG